MTVGKCSITFLPIEFEFAQFVIIDEIITCFFYLAHKIGKATTRFHSDKEMNVIRHSIYGEHFLSFSVNNTCDVFVKSLFPTFRNQALASFDSKDYLNVDLRKCSRHNEGFWLLELMIDFNWRLQHPEGMKRL